MPQTYELLRKKYLVRKIRWWWPFGHYYDDGIAKCEQILKDAGCKLHQDNQFGMIILPESFTLDKHTRGEIIDALDYLTEEWDYGTVEVK